MIDRLVQAIENLDRRVSSIEETMPFLCEQVSRIASVVARPDGYVTFSGAVNTTKDKVEEALTGSALMNLENISMEVNFSQAVFMGVRLQKNPKLAEAMSDAALQQLEKTLQQGQYILDLVDTMHEKEAELTRMLSIVRDRLSEDVGQVIEREVAVALGDTFSILEEKTTKAKKLADSIRTETDAERNRLEKAREGLEEAVRLSEATTSKLGNERKASQAQPSFVSVRSKS